MMVLNGMLSLRLFLHISTSLGYKKNRIQNSFSFAKKKAAELIQFTIGIECGGCSLFQTADLKYAPDSAPQSNLYNAITQKLFSPQFSIFHDHWDIFERWQVLSKQ